MSPRGDTLWRKKRRQYRANFKFCLALEAAKGPHMLNQLASQDGRQSNQIGQWKQPLLESGPEAGNSVLRVNRATLDGTGVAEKKLSFSLDDRQTMIQIDHPQLSIHRPYDLIDLHWAAFYSTLTLPHHYHNHIFTLAINIFTSRVSRAQKKTHLTT